MHMVELRWVEHDSPLGKLTLLGGHKGLVRIDFPDWITPKERADWARRWVAESVVLRRDLNAHKVWRKLLDRYFAGRIETFDKGGIDMKGTDFQKSVWRLLLDIPYGQTRTYGELAQELGKPGAAQAVGGANHDNPLPIVVPCHRVIGSRGELVGYAGGLRAKRWLLNVEGSMQQPQLFDPVLPVR